MGGFAVPQIENSGSGTIDALNADVTASIPAASTVAFTITGTWVATLTFEATTDGTTWFPVLATIPSTGVSGSTTTINGSFVAGTGGYQQFRVRASTYTSGTASLTYNADTTPNVQSSGQIKGATDGTGIGNVGDRLKVDAAGTAIPQTKVVYLTKNLTNGGSTDMRVNGAVTPVNFDFTPASEETWYLERITLFLWDNGTTTPTSFGALPSLTNGVQVNIRTNGTEYTYANLQNNIDIALYFRDNYFVPGTSGLFETSDLVVCEVKFAVPLVLTNSTSDYVRFRIRDNLLVMDAFRAQALVWRVAA